MALFLGNEKQIKYAMILVVLCLAALLITIWFNKVASIEKEVKLIAHNIHQHFISEIHNAAALFSPSNASAINFARSLSFSLDNNNDLHSPNIKSKVVPALFQAFSIIPYLGSRKCMMRRLDITSKRAFCDCAIALLSIGCMLFLYHIFCTLH